MGYWGHMLVMDSLFFPSSHMEVCLLAKTLPHTRGVVVGGDDDDVVVRGCDSQDVKYVSTKLT